MVPADAEEGFRVTDRRRRADDDTVPPSQHQVELPPKAEPRRAELSQPTAAPSRPPEPAAGQEAERSLAGLFVMLASSAAMAMGDAPDPETGQVHPDLAQAAELIDVLLLLRDKTEGNRTPEETQILDEILYDLQLRYVAATKKRTAAPRGPARS